jgi:hypothetical protein
MILPFLFLGWPMLCGFCKAWVTRRDVFNTPALVPSNYTRRSMLLMSVQPPISTIACKILYLFANPCYHSPCSPRQPPPRRIAPRSHLRSIPIAVILSVAKDLLFSFLLSAHSASFLPALCFHTLAHTFATTKMTTSFFSGDCTLFSQNTRVGGTPFSRRSSLSAI